MVAPARIMLWSWDEEAPKKAKALRELAEAMGAEIRPIFDQKISGLGLWQEQLLVW